MTSTFEPVASLAARLKICRERLDPWEPQYEVLVQRLRADGIGSSAPGIGDRFPNFMLPTPGGSYVGLEALVAGRPIVLSFNRGRWCPYCREEVSAWRTMSGALQELEAGLVVVTGEANGTANALAVLAGDFATVLCDLDQGVAMSLGMTFYCGPDLLRDYLDDDIDFSQIYGTASGFLSIPATFVIDRDMIVRFAFVDPDFRNRAEPSDVMAAIPGRASAT